MTWQQTQISLPACRRGFHLITDLVLQGIPQIREIKIGLLNVFLMHTSASICINENADPDVPRDLEMSFNKIAPEDFPYIHTIEGPDDMPAHVKAAMLGNSLTIPVKNGNLCLGTWQGIYLCEHRNRAGSRTLTLTLQGEQHS
ncbi:MAG: secondary thiamine-phosphate synthase enzyme YjbQ [Planctomycetota bacterium]|nr:secondary thiamine-phosphate synthase enzyme YjbQ [Planctomycetota bacterium]MDA1214384.1 secondary thiamine-phosphate synthase enzyme YjbQ [Planctomycetota bacterium]